MQGSRRAIQEPPYSLNSRGETSPTVQPLCRPAGVRLSHELRCAPAGSAVANVLADHLTRAEQQAPRRCRSHRPSRRRLELSGHFPDGRVGRATPDRCGHLLRLVKEQCPPTETTPLLSILCESRADVAAHTASTRSLAMSPASTRLLLLAMSGALKHWAQPRSSRAGLTRGHAEAHVCIVVLCEVGLSIPPQGPASNSFFGLDTQ
jgi:hypothetical protein